MLLHVHDRALPDAQFRALWRRVRAIGNERLKHSYWTTFWYDFGPPQNAVDAAVLALRRRFHFPAAGVEWWLGRADLRDVPIEPHADRDNALFDQTGRRRHPATSSVLYFNRVRGGALVVYDQRETSRGLSPSEPADWALAAPRPNRFVHFAGDRVHAVLDANNELPTKRLRPPPAPLRYSLVVNWWPQRPRDVPTWNGKIYAALALPSVP